MEKTLDTNPLLKELSNILTARGLTLSTAESCTGGLLSNMLTNVKGSSDYFKAGLIVYSVFAKIKFLEIKKNLINRYGTVSAECAQEMAKNVKKVCKTDIGISITGVAGPDKIENKKVGEVYIGLAFKRRIIVKKLNFKGEREEIKYKAANSVLKLLKKQLKYF